MKIIVIEVTRDGKTGYINGRSIFDQDGIVDEPTNAINYALPENASRLDTDLGNLHLKDDEMYARSGIKVDTAEVVEFEVVLQETARRPARKPHKAVSRG